MNPHAVVPLLMLLAGCAADPAPKATPADKAGAPKTTSQPEAAAATSICNPPVTFGPTVPNDQSLGNQTAADCFAWQEFVAVNWPSSGSGFGTPGDLQPVAWQGYMDSHELFPPNGAPPPAWGTPPQLTEECQAEAGLTDAQARGVHPLVNATKFSSEFLSGEDSDEAFPFNGDPAWLGDTNGSNVWYEVRVNEDEYDFVVQNQYYNASKQLAFYTNQNPVTTPLQLPAGCNSSASCRIPQTGAMELKAAWMEVPDPKNPDWNHYYLSAAVVVDPATQKCEAVTVALVGLHIIHKTQSQPTWVWATFEHVANAPTGVPTTGTWNFYNAQCSPQTVQVPANCPAGGPAKRVTTTCTPNTSPAYYIGDGCPAATPTQVTRVNPIDSTAASVNASIQAAIQSAYPGSVWQNYQLVNVVWSNNPPTIPPACRAGAPGCQTTTTPQLVQGINPGGAVANTVLETYLQSKGPDGGFTVSNCVVCHQDATVPGSETYASDFSFALGDATSPPSAVASRRAKAAPKAGPRQRRIIR